MTRITRLKPDPIPAFHPVPEYLADGQRKAWYEETKRVLQVPWMGVVTMAFAHYPTFYGVLWQGVRDLCRSRPFVEACCDNRAFVGGEVAKLDPPLLHDRLMDIGYAPREIEQIRQMIEVFGHGNQAYVMLATIARYLLEVGDMAGSTDPAEAPAYQERHAPDVGVPFVLMEAHHADPPTREIYEEIKQVLGLPFVNTDYRALARWPTYWATAWGDLRYFAGTPAHEEICQTFHERCVGQVAEALPNPGGITASALLSAAQTDAAIAEVRDVCRLFQWLLPGLITNVAYLRAQLLESSLSNGETAWYERGSSNAVRAEELRQHLEEAGTQVIRGIQHDTLDETGAFYEEAPRPSQRNDLPEWYDQLQNAIDRLSIGQVVFNPPDMMKVGMTERIAVRISKDTNADLVESLKGRGIPRVEELQVSELMKVRLSGNDFSIYSLSEEEQVVGENEFTEWSWDVTPRKSGKRALHLHVTLRFRLPFGEEKKDHPVLDREITVRVNPIHSVKYFAVTYWKWIVTGILIPLIAWTWNTFLQ